MTRRSVVIGLWLVFAFLAWNVIFDRLVADAAAEFTQQQVLRQQAGERVTSIHDGFSPRVRDAALQASLWTAPIVAAGVVCVHFSFRRAR
jgi:hypothetical protein